MSSALQLAFLLASLFSLTAGTDQQSLKYSIVPRQQEVNTCGFAVAAGILRAATDDVPSVVPDEAALTAIFAQHDSAGKPETATMLDLLRIFSQHGIAAIPFRGNIEDAVGMLSQGIPLVTHLKSPTEHFILAARLSPFGMAAADPDVGFQIMPMDDFSARASGFFIALPDLRNNASFLDRVNKANALELRQMGFFSHLIGGGILQKPAPPGKGVQSGKVQRESRESSLGFSVALFGSTTASAAPGLLLPAEAVEVSARLDGRLSSALSYGAVLALIPGLWSRFSASLAFRLDNGHESPRLKKALLLKAGSALEVRLAEVPGSGYRLFPEPFLGLSSSSVSDASMVSAGFVAGTSLAAGVGVLPFFQAEAGTILALSADLALQAGLTARLKMEADSGRRFVALYSTCEFGIHIPADRLCERLPGSLYAGVRISLSPAQEKTNAVIVSMQL